GPLVGRRRPLNVPPRSETCAIPGPGPYRADRPCEVDDSPSRVDPMGSRSATNPPGRRGTIGHRMRVERHSPTQAWLGSFPVSPRPSTGNTCRVILTRNWSLFLVAAGAFNWLIWPRFALAIWNDQRAWSGEIGQSSPN